MLNATLRSKVDALWDKFWSGGIANPLTAIEQISYLLFMRRLDDSDRQKVDNAKWAGREVTSLFEGQETFRWSHFRHLPGSEMLDLVRDEVFPFIRSLGREENLSPEDQPPFTRHMQDAVFIIPKASLLVEAIGIIEEIYTEIEREQTAGKLFQDTQGDLYEHLLSEIATSGKNGQFRTPRHIIQMIVSVVDPQLGNRVCDPACGSGGFLLSAYQHILTTHTRQDLRQTNEDGFEVGRGDSLTDPRQWEVLNQSTFYGYDFDSTMVRIGLMNLMLHGVEHPNIDYQDTLSKGYDERDRYDVVLANPPFKGSIDKGDINEDLTLSTTKTELLFVERIYNLLRIGGKAGVIVPDGVLFGSSKAHRALREKLIEECELQGVISLPSGVFKPYAGVSTAVVVFVKGGRTEHVWFYDVEADGYSLDDKREKVESSDLQDVIAKWKERDPKKDTDRTKKAFAVPADEIRENKYDLSINRYREIDYEPVDYDPPKVIIEKLRLLEDEIRGDLDELERML